MKKSFVLSALVCVNMLLLTGLCLSSYSLPQAHAQGTGLAGNYVIVAGEIQDAYDALYLIDLRERALHAFYYDRGTNKLVLGNSRDLERDFRVREEGGN